MAQAGNTITLKFINNLKEPKTDFEIPLQTSRALTILQLLERAAWQDPTFKYSIAYYASVPGYMLNAVKKDSPGITRPFVFYDNDNSYWCIKINGKLIPVGISCYQPKNGDTVVFELTTYHPDGAIC